MSYKVIRYFTDLHDNDHPYEVGDAYPRVGVKVTKKRIAALMSEKNLQGVPLIAEESADDGKNSE
ncbi:hypothetical protein [Butyricicoccus sp.]|uniref:hypothetical protein n=1 Tax=Butyricicoccus sp. TaxID=2049021 RepID=UPI003D7F00B6